MQVLGARRHSGLAIGHSPSSRKCTALKAVKDVPEKVGFRYDKANLRWVRDTRIDQKMTEQDLSLVTVVPKTGSPYLVWPAVFNKLLDYKLKTVSIEECVKLQRQGWTIVDVRTESEYEKQHIDGAVSLPLYRKVAGSSFFDNLKRVVVTLAMAMTATERDPDFRDKAKATLPRNAKVIVYCGLGGTMQVGVKDPKGEKRGQKFVDDPERNFGRESRSLKAAFELFEAGFRNVLHMQGGISQWRYDGNPVTSGKEP